MNNRLENLIVSALVMVIGVGGYGLFLVSEPETLDQDAVVDAVLEEVVVEDGVQGPRGYTGKDGLDGVAGPIGPQGPTGTSTSIDLDDLADDVADLLDDRDDGEVFSLRCSAGETSHQFEVDDDGVFRFEFRNYGSGDFSLYLTDEDGDDRDIINGSGNTTKVSTITLHDNELYTVTINAEDSCKLTVEER